MVKLKNLFKKIFTIFLLIYNKHKKMLPEENHSDVAGSLLDDIGYTEMLQNEKTIESEGRLENLKKLVVDIKNRNSIGEFLEEVSLLTENINQKDEEDKSLINDSSQCKRFRI